MHNTNDCTLEGNSSTNHIVKVLIGGLWNMILVIVIRNGSIDWKVIWIEYYFRLNLHSRRY